MEVCSFDPFISQKVFDNLGVKRFYDFNDFLASIDFLSIHAPHTEETKHIINLQSLKKDETHSVHCEYFSWSADQ